VSGSEEQVAAGAAAVRAVIDDGGDGGGGGPGGGPCYAFQKGECTRGDACKFSHGKAVQVETGWTRVETTWTCVATRWTRVECAWLQRLKQVLMYCFQPLLSISTSAAKPRRRRRRRRRRREARGGGDDPVRGLRGPRHRQGLTLVHLAAQPEPFLTQNAS